jgi:hypothetical protein
MFRLYLSLLFFLVFSSFFSFSQRKFKRFNHVDGISINPNIGVGSVMGELGDVFAIKPVYGINFEKGISEKFNIGICFGGGKLIGSENEPYFSRFESDYFQIHSIGVINISRYFIDNYFKKNTEFKLYGGVGLIWFKTDVYDLKTGIFLRATADGTTRHTAYFQQAGNGIGDSKQSKLCLRNILDYNFQLFAFDGLDKTLACTGGEREFFVTEKHCRFHGFIHRVTIKTYSQIISA